VISSTEESHEKRKKKREKKRVKCSSLNVGLLAGYMYSESSFD
jgi:hypothetical protein